jgi:hypothetical protein
VSLGFTPRWYRDRLGVDFSEAWHLDPGYRRDSLVAMRSLLHEEFPTVDYFFPERAERGARASDTISGVYGIMLVPSLYGLEIVYRADGWPDAAGGRPVAREDLADILDAGPFDLSDPASLPGGGVTLRALFSQMDEIERRRGPVHGYPNYQGILNVALKLRGADLFIDMIDDPDFAHRLFGHVAVTIGALSKLVQARQRASGFDVDLLSLSNCVMSMISPAQYEDFVLPLDLGLSGGYLRFGIHTCNWNIGPYRDSLAKIPRMGYIDTGMSSDLAAVKARFPVARRAVMYGPGDLERKDLASIAADFERLAREYAPCDIVLADIETTTTETRVRDALALTKDLEKLAIEASP